MFCVRCPTMLCTLSALICSSVVLIWSMFPEDIWFPQSGEKFKVGTIISASLLSLKPHSKRLYITLPVFLIWSWFPEKIQFPQWIIYCVFCLWCSLPNTLYTMSSILSAISLYSHCFLGTWLIPKWGQDSKLWICPYTVPPSFSLYGHSLYGLFGPKCQGMIDCGIGGCHVHQYTIHHLFHCTSHFPCMVNASCRNIDYRAWLISVDFLSVFLSCFAHCLLICSLFSLNG